MNPSTYSLKAIARYWDKSSSVQKKIIKGLIATRVNESISIE